VEAGSTFQAEVSLAAMLSEVILLTLAIGGVWAELGLVQMSFQAPLSMLHFPITPNTLDYVLALEAEGHTVSDVSLTKMRPSLYRLRLTLDDGTSREFFHEASSGDDIVRFQEEISAHAHAYGPRSLLESIHREVLDRARTENCSAKDFVVLLSNDLFQNGERYLAGYRGYGYIFRVAADHSGIWYSISRISAQ
jgi:hypothetical protein